MRSRLIEHPASSADGSSLPSVVCLPSEPCWSASPAAAVSRAEPHSASRQGVRPDGQRRRRSGDAHSAPVERVRHRRRGGPGLLHHRLHQAGRTATAAARAERPWYAATLIKWPDKAQVDHGDALAQPHRRHPILCIAQSSDEQTSVVMYFERGRQGDDREAADQQGSVTSRPARSTQALKGAAQAAVAARGRRQVPRRRDPDAGPDGAGPLRQDAPTTAAAATETRNDLHRHGRHDRPSSSCSRSRAPTARSGPPPRRPRATRSHRVATRQPKVATFAQVAPPSVERRISPPAIDA